MKKAEIKQKSLFGKWLFIQICFLSLMILVSLGLYLYTNHHIKRQIDELHEGNILTMQTQIETTLDSVKSAVNEYSISPNVRTLLNLEPDTHGRELALLVDDIKQKNATVPGMLELIVYFKESGLFVSSAGVMDESVFVEVYSDGTGGIVQTLNDNTNNDELQTVNYARNGESVYTAMYTETVSDSIIIAALCRQNTDGEYFDWPFAGRKQSAFCRHVPFRYPVFFKRFNNKYGCHNRFV